MFCSQTGRRPSRFAHDPEVEELDVQLDHNPGYPQGSSTKALAFKTAKASLKFFDLA
jgi:hypothetical protein